MTHRRIIVILLTCAALVVLFSLTMWWPFRKKSPSSQHAEAWWNQPSDEGARQRLLKRISMNGDIKDLDTPRPLVSLEEFFDGNNDAGSIGYNFYPDQPSPQEFFALFKQIRERPEVADVRVEVTQLEDPDGWPSSDTVWIITKASADDVQVWLGERFRADDIYVGWGDDRKRETMPVPDGMTPLGVWWD